MFKARRTRGGADAQAIAGTGDTDILRWTRDVVAQVAGFEPAMQALSDSELAAQTAALRARHESAEGLESLLAEAFATVREAAVRALGQRPFDTQVMGGAALHLGKVVEMRTGEGKTLAATMPAYLNALAGHGVHVLTANEYLAGRDAGWMTPVYRALGLQVGLLAGASVAERKAAYLADVTYGAADEFCYDYLRDHLAWEVGDCVQRGLRYAVVDEADLVMIDDARSLPMISSNSDSADVPDLPYSKLAEIAASLRPDVDYTATPHRAEVALTDEGAQAVEDLLGIDNLYEPANLAWAHGLQKALEAAVLFQRDRDYIVSGNAVLFVDPVSGRAERRPFAGGLQQAIEAKEGVEVQRPQRTLAVIAVNEYLKQYQRLGAMTGTAASDAASYTAIYGLGVVVIPTNRPMIRVDHAGPFYATSADKLDALVKQVVRRQESGQPVLIGSGSIEQSAVISGMLTRREISHEVLTAKNNEREAEIIAGSARLGAVTVIARMAGRGVDIVLGGPEATQAERDQVANVGGLCVLGAERFANRRLELHLRGRAGRQGDPGESELFASFEDDAALTLLGTASAARNRRMLSGKGGMRSQTVSRIFDRAQTSWAASLAERVRKQLEFDVVLSDQRRDIYAEHDEILTAADLSDRMRMLTAQLAEAVVDEAADDTDGMDARRCKEALLSVYPTVLSTSAIARAVAARQSDPKGDALGAMIRADVARAYALREAEIGAGTMRSLERAVSLSAIDACWREHLGEMEALRDGISLRAIGGRSPLAEYRREADLLLRQMHRDIHADSVRKLFNVELEFEPRRTKA
jgi:preprotein translocase subunit SecA